MSADREAKTPVCASQSDRTSLAERVAPIQTRARALGATFLLPIARRLRI